MDAERTYYELLADGDEEATADYEQWPGARRRHDPVSWWPRDRLGELVEMTPPDQRSQLIAELMRRRPSEVEQR